MKILHVFDHSIPLQSGYTFRSRAILRAQRQRGWQTVHLTSGKQGDTRAAIETVDGLEFHRTPPPHAWTTRIPALDQCAILAALARRVREVIARERPDLVHAHSPAINGVAAVRAARAAGVPVTYEIRAFWEDAAVDHGTSREGGLRYRATRALEEWVLRRVDAVFTICEGLRADLVARGLPASLITVIPNAVDAEHFQFGLPRDRALAEQLGIGDRPVLGFIGSFYAYEGLVDLVRALPTVVARRPELRVLLVGGGPCHAEVAALVRALGLGGNVILTGRVPHAEVDRYYTLVDVFCYPRRPMRLTELVTPLKPLEAMAQGRLVLASDVGGHRELIRHGDNGWLFEAGAPTALADGILAAFAASERWPELRMAGRRYVETERNWPRSVAGYAPVYERLVGDRR
jgi:PEP-CTERM/exosortase A-associated glycosyltransferase